MDVGFQPPSEETFHGKFSFGDTMEDVARVHEGSRWICKVDACTNSYVTK